MKNILVEFECTIGEYEHRAHYIFYEKKSEWEYCKEFWGITEKNVLDEITNSFWDDQGMNAIRVCSELEISDEEARTLGNLGIV